MSGATSIGQESPGKTVPLCTVVQCAEQICISGATRIGQGSPGKTVPFVQLYSFTVQCEYFVQLMFQIARAGLCRALWYTTVVFQVFRMGMRVGHSYERSIFLSMMYSLYL
jgi:hypothetical protein